MILQIKTSGWGVHVKDIGKPVRVVGLKSPEEEISHSVQIEPLEGLHYHTREVVRKFGCNNWVLPETFGLSYEEIREKFVEWWITPEEGGISRDADGQEDSCSSISFLKRAIELQEERGRDYDSPEGERSMGKTVEAFNAITGKTLSEAEGWLLLQLLKDVRQWSVKGRYHKDSAEDCVSYAALKAEALSKQL